MAVQLDVSFSVPLCASKSRILSFPTMSEQTFPSAEEQSSASLLPITATQLQVLIREEIYATTGLEIFILYR